MPCVKVTVRERPKPNIVVEDVWTTDAEGNKKYEFYTDEKIYAHAKLHNKGDAGGNIDLKITVDGSTVKTDNVYVGAGAIKEVTYEIGALSKGDHEVCIDKASVQVIVYG